MIKKIFTISLFVFSFLTMKAQEDGLPSSKSSNSTSTSFKSVPAELKTRTQTFFNDLMINKVDEAFDKLLQNSPITKKTEEILALKRQTKRSFELYEVIKGYEPVNNQFVSNSYIRLRYIGLHTKYPMRWVFTFYKSPDLGWIVTDIKYDDLSNFFFEDE